MKRFFVLMLLALQSLLWSSEADAAPCVTGSFGSYSSLGATGCTIGSVTFSGFFLQPPANGAVNSSSITVTPVMVGGTMVGVTFGVSPTGSGGSYYDDLISYRISGNGSTINGATVDFAGSSVVGDAAVSVAESLCLGGTFGADGVSGCSTGNTVNLAVLDVGFGPDPAFSQSFAAFAALAVATDIAFDSGVAEGSSSTLTSATNLFNVVAAPRVVPEPPVAALFAAAAFGLAVARRRRRGARA